MGVNDDRLSAGEQNELRALVTAGAGRMRAARRRRMQAITGGAAVLLVAAVVGAVALTALGSPDRVATPIETTTSPSPTPDPTATTDAPAAAVVAFDGSCANVVASSWLTERVGRQMEELPLAWPVPQIAFSGALSCWWHAPGAYAVPRVEIDVSPADAIDGSPLATNELSCTERDAMCAVSIAANGAWIQIRAYGENSNEWVAQLAEDVAERAFQFAPPQRAGRDGPDAGWWALRDCDWVETIAVPDGVTMPPEPSGADSELDGLYAEVRRGRAGFSTDCTWHVLVESELGSVAGDVGVSIVPGGAQFFDRIAASDGAQLISVDGADRAATVRGLERLEGYDTRLVVASGENLLIISGDNGVPPESLAYLVEPYLTALNATLG